MRKLNGGGVLPPKSTGLQLAKGFIGGTLGILVLSLLGQYSGTPWLMAPFGATCVLLFAVPSSPLAQPRNVIGGHFVAALVGLIALYAFGDSIYVMSLAVGFAIVLMQLLRMVHPPAGANPIVIILAGTVAVDFSFLITPVLVGSVALVCIATIVNNTSSPAKWPLYWYGSSAKGTQSNG
ncbi:HPP family protein [Vibrio sp. HN007]|uniref:HPP family protein n=1 Tax=Vibrio iocasae TaxID=3098914 RepID=UPI0035D4D102